MAACKYGIVNHGTERCTCAAAFAQAGVQAPARLSDLGRAVADGHRAQVDRQRARAMFEAAGKPVPKWCA
jgi:hypothetical protein